jgi:hypothetical protein
LLRCREMTQWASFELSRRNKQRASFDQLVGAEQE